MASEGAPSAGAQGAAKPPRARLISIGPGAPREFSLDRAEVSIGSASDNDLVIDETTVSRHHARIFTRLGRFQVSDLESTNGTYVGGRRVRGSAPIRPGDEIRFGAARFAFVAGGRDGSAPRSMLRRIGPAAAAGIPIVLFVAAFAFTRYEFTARRDEMRQAFRHAAASGGTAPSARDESRSGSRAPAPAAVRRAATGPAPAGSAPEAAEPPWLAMLNRYRGMARLGAVTRDAKLDGGDQAHVNYLFHNYAATIRGGAIPGLEMHLETPGNPWYSAAGAASGKLSDVDYVSWDGPTPAGVKSFAIEDWIGGAFHRLPLLSPRLRAVGYDDRCDDHVCIAAMNAQSDVDSPKLGVPYGAPVEFPGPGSRFDMTTFSQEFPDPLASCPGYKAPTGVPITVQVGADLPVTMQSFKLERIDAGGRTAKLEACGFDLTNYHNPDLATETLARELLKEHGAVVVIPRRPFVKGATYRVSISAGGKLYDWSFSVVP